MYRVTKHIYLIIALLCQCLTAKAQIDVEHVVSIGRNALYFNDYVVAISYFNRAIDTRPWLAEPYLYRSIAKISLEDYNGAANDASLCIQNNPYISRAYLIRGIAYQNLGRYTEASEDYKQGISLAPDNGQMRFNLAVAQMHNKAYTEAEQSLDSLLYYSPRYPEAYTLGAHIALERQDTTLALRRIAEASRVDNGNSMIDRLKASIAAARGQWHEGIESLSRVLDLEGRSADLYSNRAMMYYQVNKLKSALSDYSQALEIDPKHRISLNNRAILYQQVGEKRLSLQDWNRLISLEPTNYIARYNRAMLQMETGQDLRIALNDLDTVLRQYPSFVDGFMQRALLRNKLGDKKGASDDYWHAGRLVQDKKISGQAKQQARQNQQRLTKDEGDLSIDKYSLLIESKTKQVPETKYKRQERGRVQDRDVEVEHRGMYYLSFFPPHQDEGREALNTQAHYGSMLEVYNQQGDSLVLRIQAIPMALSEEQIQQLNQILALPEAQGDSHYYLRRGIVYSLLQDYEQAILDYNRVLALDSRHSLALFARAIASMRHTEARKQKGAEEREMLSAPSPTTGSSKTSEGLGSYSRGLELIPSAMQDLAQLLMYNPDFAYAYYNRAILYTSSGERIRAIEDYSRAIALQPRLAEAYYNRALLYFAEGQHEAGIRDMSQAGELGLYEAYNILKRMR